MKTTPHASESGSTIICALSAILIISLIGANVLLNCASRYNVTTKQVKAWKEALYAAEAGGDIGFAETRKVTSAPGTEFTSWTSPAASPAPSPVTGTTYSKGVSTPFAFGPSSTTYLTTSVWVDKIADVTGWNYYRIRSVGTAKMFGLKRTGMDAALVAGVTHFASGSLSRGDGDTLLRKIDFNYDHYKATYGDGDGSAGIGTQTVTNPQITRRIELVSVPQFAITGALKATGTFDGPGSAGVVDSYNSKNGAYSFVANNPASPYYADSRNGDVSVGTSSFQEGGPIYGNVSTNGGNVTHAGTSISGIIDNNVPFTLPPLVKPDTSTYTTGPSGTLNVPTGTTAGAPATYVYSTLSGGLTINGQNVAGGLPNAGQPAEVFVKIVVNGDVGGTITVKKGVNAEIWFTGDLSTKASRLVNNNVDAATGVYNANGTASTRYSRAGHMQFYGITPTDGSTGSISIGPPGNVWASFYAPNHDMSMTGNPDVYGAIAVHDFSGNGNTGFHYDTQLAVTKTIAIDYQIASYVEDVR